MTDAGEVKVLEQVDTDVFGRKGDFITSPEISQMFGEVSSPVHFSADLGADEVAVGRSMVPHPVGRSRTA
jgi:hypothetical protein